MAVPARVRAGTMQRVADRDNSLDDDEQPAAVEGTGLPVHPPTGPAQLLRWQTLTPRAPFVPGAAMLMYPMAPLISSVHAQWAADPVGGHQWRWWNGAFWTENVADDGVVRRDPLPRTA